MAAISNNNVINFNRILLLFPRPITESEHCAFDHMLAQQMTLTEADIYVHPLKSKKKQREREEALRVVCIKRLRKKWDRRLAQEYRDWVIWYGRYGEHARGRSWTR